MPTLAPEQSIRTVSCGIIVDLASDLASIQSPDGSLVPSDKLGHGVVQRSAAELVLVHWVAAGFESWVDNTDLRSPGSDAHLIIVRKYSKHGVCKQLRYKVGTGIGLGHNWTVEMRSNNVLRVLRCDGSAWTFTRSPIFRTVQTCWPQPPDDEDAEALTVAELSLK